jgi:hypothetical protein
MHTISISNPTIQPVLISHPETRGADLIVLMPARITVCHEVGTVSSLGTTLRIKRRHLPTVSGSSFWRSGIPFECLCDWFQGMLD